MKIVLGGPSQSGKSCLREGLKTVLMEFHRFNRVPYPYFITACPDGEGAWFSETAQNDPELARKLKEEYKSQFTWEFTERVAANVRDIKEPLVLIDVGGKIDEKNRQILSGATHAIILSGELDRMPEWQNFCEDLGLTILAILHSDYNGTSDRLDAREPILRGSIHRLERGEDVSGRSMIRELAELLVRMCGSDIYCRG
jgi:CRISPR-associated protein Csx3